MDPVFWLPNQDQQPQQSTEENHDNIVLANDPNNNRLVDDSDSNRYHFTAGAATMPSILHCPTQIQSLNEHVEEGKFFGSLISVILENWKKIYNKLEKRELYNPPTPLLPPLICFFLSFSFS